MRAGVRVSVMSDRAITAIDEGIGSPEESRGEKSRPDGSLHAFRTVRASEDEAINIPTRDTVIWNWK